MGQGSMLYPVKSCLCRLLEMHFADIRFLSALGRGSCLEICLETAREHKSLFKGQYFKVLQNGHFVFRSSVKGRRIGGRKKTSSGQSH